MAVSSVASRLSSLRGSLTGAGVRLADCFDKPLVEDIFNCAIKRQTGVTLRHMLDFGANPVERQLLLSAQFLHQELPVRLAHRVAELENLPYGLSAKPHVLKVRAQLTVPAPPTHTRRYLPKRPSVEHQIEAAAKAQQVWDTGCTDSLCAVIAALSAAPTMCVAQDIPLARIALSCPGPRLVCGVFQGPARVPAG